MARGDEAYDGLANLAHAVRRSTAMYVAMNMTPSDGTIEDMFTTFELIAARIGGQGAEQDAEEEPSQPLGVSWRHRDEA